MLCFIYLSFNIMKCWKKVFNVVVFLDFALPRNCNVLSVKALEFQVWFGMNTFLWQTFSLKDTCLFVVSYSFEPLCGKRDWLNMGKNLCGVLAGRKGNRQEKTDYIKDSRKMSQEEKKNILLLMLNNIPILGTVHIWENWAWYLF